MTTVSTWTSFSHVEGGEMHICIGVFALVTVVLAGAALGRIVGWSAGEGAYLTMLVIAVVGWWITRRARREEQPR
jgi:lipoprotein signal peptidase